MRRLLSFIVIGTALMVAWIGRSGERPVPPAGGSERTLAAELTPAEPARAAGAREALPAVAGVSRATEDLLERLHDRAGRNAALEEALADPELARWLLARLEQADFPSTRKRELGWLLRGVLTVWAELPAPPPWSRAEYLALVVAAGARHDRPADAIAFAWERQRLLDAEQLPLVETARPERIDGLQPHEDGAARASMFLVLLEDALRCQLERGFVTVVLRYCEDPSPAVRALAWRLWSADERSGGWEAAIERMADLGPQERLAIAREIAQIDPPERAAELLREAELRWGPEGGFLPAWVDLGGRRPDLVGKVYADLLQAGQLGAMPEGDYLLDPALDPGDHQLQADVFREGRGRANLLTAYLVTAEHAGCLDWELIGDAVLRDWNPIVRDAAWTSLAGSGVDGAAAEAYQHLLDPGWREAARIPGVPGDGHLVPGLQALAGSLVEPHALLGLRGLLDQLEIGAEERAGLVASIDERLARAGDM